MKTFWDRGQNGGKKHFSYTELETSFVPSQNGKQRSRPVPERNPEGSGDTGFESGLKFELTGKCFPIY